MSNNKTAPIITRKYYKKPSLFRPENLLREARRQKDIPKCPVPVICFAHLTNSMARKEGDFEKGEAFGSPATSQLLSSILHRCDAKQLSD